MLNKYSEIPIDKGKYDGDNEPDLALKYLRLALF